DGSLYALDPTDGSPIWTSVVRPSPVTPSFAGFGLFDGAVGFTNDRFFASLYDFTPPIAVPPKHLRAFSAADGSTAWEDEIGSSWGSVGLGGGLLATGALGGTNLYVYDAATGVRLKTLTLPGTVAAGPTFVDGTLYVGYGLGGAAGGVAAFGLPRSGRFLHRPRRRRSAACASSHSASPSPTPFSPICASASPARASRTRSTTPRGRTERRSRTRRSSSCTGGTGTTGGSTKRR